MPTTTLNPVNTGKFFANRSKNMAAAGQDPNGWGDEAISRYLDTNITDTEYNAWRTVYLGMEEKADNAELRGTAIDGTTTFDINDDPDHPLPPIRGGA